VSATRIEVRDGTGKVVLVYETEVPGEVKMRTEVSTEKGHAVAWLEREGEILDSIELDLTTLPGGLHRVDTTIDQ
jgi:hypothetical protein